VGGTGNGRTNEAVRRRVGELRAAGLTYAVIGRRLGLSERQVAGALRRERPAARVLPCRECGTGVGPGRRRGVAPRPPLCLACLGRAPGAGLPDRLLSLRLAAGLTQAELARRTGLRRDRVARLEAGHSGPGPAEVACLALVLGPGLTADGGGAVRPSAAPEPRRGSPLWRSPRRG
jgi:transcriptional regulator with XRE-family HTH domain